MLSPKKSLLAFALIAALAVFAGGALAANTETRATPSCVRTGRR